MLAERSFLFISDKLNQAASQKIIDHCPPMTNASSLYPRQFEFASESAETWMRLGCLSLRDIMLPYICHCAVHVSITWDNSSEADAPVLS